jgi:hypothetical protein
VVSAAEPWPIKTSAIGDLERLRRPSSGKGGTGSENASDSDEGLVVDASVRCLEEVCQEFGLGPVGLHLRIVLVQFLGP